MTLNEITKLIRDVPDFPKPGIVFKDITPLLAHPQGFRAMVAQLSALVPPNTTKIAAIESRGFILGAALAQAMGVGLTLMRKPGKLPYATLSHSYALEYGQDTLQIHVDSFSAADQVCIVDDVLATGGTAAAAEVLCMEAGAKVNAAVFLMELGFLNGRKKMSVPVKSLIAL